MDSGEHEADPTPPSDLGKIPMVVDLEQQPSPLAGKENGSNNRGSILNLKDALVVTSESLLIRDFSTLNQASEKDAFVRLV